MCKYCQAGWRLKDDTVYGKIHIPPDEVKGDYGLIVYCEDNPESRQNYGASGEAGEAD